jgi:DNA repair exonuclease SbcCD nuclease subunit
MKPMEAHEVALKILHTSDWHLGRRFPSFSEEDEKKLTRARIEAVDRVFGVAESYTVNAVLCAGDLFDDPTPADSWWRGLLKVLERRKWNDRPVFLLPGNHDPLEPNSVWAEEHPFRRSLPSWVHVVDRDNYEFQISDEAVLYAAPCRSQAGSDDLALRLPSRAPGDERIRIGLVHGQTFDIPGYQTNFPIALDAAQQRGLTYLAIGDTHAFRELPPKTCPTVYPSSPEAMNFGEQETGCVAVVFFPRRGRAPIVQKQAVAQWQWRDERCENLAELEALREEDLKNCVVRLTLTMEVSLPDLDRVEAIVNELKGTEVAHGKAGILQIDRAGLSLNSNDLGAFDANLPDVLKAVVAKLQAKALEPEGMVAQRALYQLYRIVKETGK